MLEPSSAGNPLPHDAAVHPDDFVRADPSFSNRAMGGSDVVHDRAVSSEVHDFSHLELLVRRGEDLVRHGAVPLVHAELHPHLIDPLRPYGIGIPRSDAGNAATARLNPGDGDSRVPEIELLSDGHLLVRRELERGPLGLLEPGHDERDVNRLRLAHDDRRDVAAGRALHGTLEDELVLPRDLAAKHTVRSQCAARLAPQDQGTRGRHGLIEREEGEKGLRWLEPDAPAAVADDPPDRAARGPPPLGTAGAPADATPPPLPGFRKVAPSGQLWRPPRARGRRATRRPRTGNT